MSCLKHSTLCSISVTTRRTETFWSPKYVQHSAHIEPGREGLFNLIKSISRHPEI